MTVPQRPNQTLPMKARSTRIAHRLSAVALCSVALSLGLPVVAQDSLPIPTTGDLATRFPINEADPAASIPSQEQRNSDPLEFGYWLQDMLVRAEGAFAKQDWPGVVKYYGALKQALPDRVMSSRRLCSAHAALGARDTALEHCQQSLAMEGAMVQDHLHYLDLALQGRTVSEPQRAVIARSLDHLREHARLHPQALPGDEVASEEPQAAASMSEAERKADPDKYFRLKVAEALAEAAGEAAGEAEATAETTQMHLPTQVEIFSCRLGVITADAERLAQCTKRLAAYRFPTALLVPFVWAKALAEGDEAQADKILAHAKREGIPEAAIAQMREEQARMFGAAPTETGTTTGSGSATAPTWGLAALAAILVVGGVAFVWRRRRVDTAFERT